MASVSISKAASEAKEFDIRMTVSDRIENGKRPAG